MVLFPRSRTKVSLDPVTLALLGHTVPLGKYTEFHMVDLALDSCETCTCSGRRMAALPPPSPLVSQGTPP